LYGNFKQISFGESRPVLLPSAGMLLQSDSSIPLLRGPVPLSHLFIRNFVCAGDNVVDATCGNGHDTLLLAEYVGRSGCVWGFDIQESAIAETGRRLSENGLLDRVKLLQAGHEEMKKHVNTPSKMVLFNLGYLPGGDHRITTSPETTVTALTQALELLMPNGMVMVTVYPGHSGGFAEQKVVNDWAAGLDPKQYYSWRMGQTNVVADAPYNILAQKVA
jgi:SAM-dependent methyltransferase